MKHPKLLVIATATIVAGGSVFIAGGTAQAAPTPSVEYVNSAAQLTPTATINPTDDTWHTYDETAAPAFTVDGAVTTESDTILFHKTVAPLTSLSDIGAAGVIVSTGDVAPLLVVTGTAGSYVVEPSALGQDAFAADTAWIAFPVDAPTSTPAQGTLPEIEQQLTTADPTNAVSAYGFESFSGNAPITSTPEAFTSPLTDEGGLLTPSAVPAGSSSVATLVVNGAETHFTPTPVASASTIVTTPAAFTTTGIQVTSTGFLPGETVLVGFGNGASGGLIDGLTFTADATGTVSGTVVAPAGTTAGAATITLIGQTSLVSVQLGISVVDPAAVAAPVATPVRAAATFAG